MIIENSFGTMLKNLREERKLPLREVAEVLDIDTSMLSKIEKNQRKPTKALISKIAKFYNVSAKKLTIAFLSDTVVYQVMHDEDFATEVLKVAEKKIKYLKGRKSI